MSHSEQGKEHGGGDHEGHFIFEFIILLGSVAAMAPAVFGGASPMSGKFQAIAFVPHPETLVTAFLALYALRFWLGWQLTAQDPAFREFDASIGKEPGGHWKMIALKLLCFYAGAALLAAAVSGKLGFWGLIAVLAGHLVVLIVVNKIFLPVLMKSDQRGRVFIFIIIGDVVCACFLAATCLFLFVGYEASLNEASSALNTPIANCAAAVFLFLFGCTIPIFLGEVYSHYMPTIVAKVQELKRNRGL